MKVTLMTCNLFSFQSSIELAYERIFKCLIIPIDILGIYFFHLNIQQCQIFLICEIYGYKFPTREIEIGRSVSG